MNRQTEVSTGVKANGSAMTAKPTVAQLMARIQELERAATVRGRLSFKVGEKGTVSVYGMGRFPVSLYAEQWERLFEAMPALKEFIKANAAGLKRKNAV